MKHLYSIPLVFFSLFVFVDSRAASRDCHDRFHNCDSWKRSGFCGANSHMFYLRSGCAKSCGFCTSDHESAVGSLTNLYPVKVLHPAGSKLGNPANIDVAVAPPKNIHKGTGNFGHKKPRVSPAKDEGASLEEKQARICGDRFVTQTCKEWKDEGICMDMRYRKYLTYGCAMTCRFCNCRDTDRELPYCAEWKSRGFCETYKDQMDSYCPKTCGFCISAVYEEENTTATPPPGQNATAPPTPPPGQNVTTQPTPPQNATVIPPGAQNATGQNATGQPGTPGVNGSTRGEVGTKIIRGHPIQFTDNGNVNTKRGLSFSEGNSPLWSVNAGTRVTLPQPEQYDEMGGGVSRPLEDGTYFTPSKSNDKFDYYTEHYSPDPYVAAAQREEWMSANHGITGGPSLSRKSKKPEVKQSEESEEKGKESSKDLKKTNIRHKHGKH